MTGLSHKAGESPSTAAQMAVIAIVLLTLAGCASTPESDQAKTPTNSSRLSPAPTIETDAAANTTRPDSAEEFDSTTTLTVSPCDNHKRPSLDTDPPPTDLSVKPETGYIRIMRMRLVKVAEGACNPIFLAAGWRDDHAYLAEQHGRVMFMAGNELSTDPVLDITDRVFYVPWTGDNYHRTRWGLLSVAVHPTNPFRIYVHYTNLDRETTVSEFVLSHDGKTADPGSERILATVRWRRPNLNGGIVQFSPYGLLYMGLGKRTLGVLDPKDDSTELWWYWETGTYWFWVDQGSGLVYVVGGGIDSNLLFAAFTPEEHLFVKERYRYGIGTTKSVHDFEGDWGCGLISGVVYRGKNLPDLHGHYVYSDYCEGWLRNFKFDGDSASEHTSWDTDLTSVISFGTDASGEMYILTTDSVYRVERVS